MPALSFVKSYAGANPLPQTVTIASTGATFNVKVTSVTTASGGSWLTVSGCPSYCGTPHAITVTVNASAALSPGTYTGQIIFTEYYNTFSMTVPVTLTVAPTGGVFLDNTPGQLSFSLRPSGTAPPSQTIEIRNGGPGTLTWTLTATTSDGGSWLSASAPNGSAPSLVNITVTPQHLPGGGVTAGTFVGQLMFQTASGNVTIPISVVVGTAAFSQVNPISFTKPYAGADPLPQVLTIASTGTDFNFSATASTATGGNWLAVSGCGSYCSTPHAITATVSASASLAAGTYTGQIVLTEYYGSMAITVPVTLTVATSGASFFDNIPGQMSFSLKTGGAAPPDQTLEIRNGGTGTLNWTLAASTSDGGDWLNASAVSGTAPSLVSVTVAPQNLPGAGVVVGTFIGELVFRTDGSSVTVPVSVTVGDNVFRQVNAISFTKPYAGADPLPQVLTIASTGTDFNFRATASTATGGNWLTVSGCGSYCSTPHAITATVSASASLAAGTYTGQIVLTEYYGSMAITVPVTLTVATSGASFFDNIPGQMSFSLKTGGAAPPDQTLEIRNGGTGTLNWTLAASTSDGGNWLNASAVSGTAPSLVSVTVAPQNLPGAGVIAGTYVGELVFRTNGGSVTVSVSVRVGDNVFRQVNAISFTKPYGGADPLPQVLTIASTGTDFNFRATASTATGGSWLTVSGCGTYCSTPHAIIATVNAAASLPAGTYTGQIVLTEYYGSMAITVPVTLTVGPAGAFFDNMQGHMSFSFTPGSAGPAAQTVQIRNAGSGTLTWTLATSTSDGGHWLSASALIGTAPSVVTIGLSPANLPGTGLIAGTFNGELVFRSAQSSVTVPVSVIVGPSVFVQMGGIGFTKPFGGSNPPPQNLTISSTGNNFDFRATASTATGGNWLTVSGCGSYCSTPHAITATVNADAALPSGTYTGQIVFTEYYNSMAMTVPVILTVGSGSPPPPTAMRFVPVLPCRVADTRNPDGAFGGPFLAAGVARDFAIPSSSCSIPSTAAAYSLNVTVVPPGPLGYLSVWPAGQTQPLVSTLNSLDGRIKANAAIVPAGASGAVSFYASNNTHLVVDINGYFVPASDATALAFYPLTPCRIADTRNPPGPFGQPFIAGGQSRTFPIQSSSCSVPSTAQAYSLNYTVVPKTSLGFLTTWPTGQTRPQVSTLNALTGAITANAAIVPAGDTGAIDVFVSNDSDVVIDINGYFGPAASGGLSLYNVTPCRVLDTRNPPGSPPFTGALDIAVTASGCAVPVTAQAFVLNATVVPPSALGYLTLWPQGASQPIVSTLNALDGAVTSNMAIVPTTNGSVSAFSSNPTYLVLDIAGYFAP